MTQAPARRGVGRRRGPEAGGAPWAPGSPKRPRPFAPKGSPGWLGASHRHVAGVLCRFLRGRSERPTPSHVLSLGTQDRHEALVMSCWSPPVPGTITFCQPKLHVGQFPNL